jgi:multidrug efflux pump subunit AcrA (membrane-fusion protein)
MSTSETTHGTRTMTFSGSVRGLCEAQLPPDQFAEQLIQLMLHMVEGEYLATWQCVEETLHVVHAAEHISENPRAEVLFQAQADAVGDVFATGQARAEPLVLSEFADGPAICYLAPLFDGPQMTAVIAIVARGETAADIDARLAMLAAVGYQVQAHRLATQWVEPAVAHAEAVSQARVVADAITAHLELKRVAFEVVNQLRSYLHCDRVSLATRRGDHYEVQAISGQALFDKRSNLVTSLAKLATRVARTGKPVCYPWEETAPQIRQTIDRFLEHAGSQQLILVPLMRYAEPRKDAVEIQEIMNLTQRRAEACEGVLVLESIEQPLDPDQVDHAWSLVRDSVTNAVANARNHHSLFLMPVWQQLGRFAELFRGRTRNKAVAITAAVAIASTAMLVTPADFKLRSEGAIQPSQRTHVFAKADGTIAEILVNDGDWVTESQLLFRIENPELEATLAEVEGNLREAQAQALTIALQRSSGEIKQESELKDLVRRAASLDAKIGGLEIQRELLRQKADQLLVRSPRAGQVLTWDIQQRLRGRPLTAGQKLVTIAEPEGPWELELKLPDKRSGYLLQAWQDVKQDNAALPVSFVLSSRPTIVGQATVRDVSLGADVDPKDGNIVRVIAALDDQQRLRLAPKAGTTVIAHVHCGKRSWAYCKLYEFFDWTRRIWFSIG